ncbi:unnamed protein product [Rhizophagus irregularis]|nr:unnamed protein product [Rhizophagus irregularis]
MSSQDIECSKYSRYLKNEFINWTSGNERIDDFIQGIQLEINDHQDVVFEWIPYNQFEFDEIEQTGKNSFMTIYSAIWKNGPLYWNIQYEEYVRDPNRAVALKYLHNLQNPIELVINEVKKYSTKNEAFSLYGISENLETNDYILVQKHVSGNEKIDDFIQEMQLKVEDKIFEWIPYSQFNEIKETGKNNFMTTYSAIWKNDPLYYNNWGDEYMSNSNKEVALKILHNLQNPVEFVINEVKKYSTKNESFLILYGISQNPYTKDYILVQNNSINLTNWISGNEKIDHFIQEMQLELEDHYDIVFEWIPYINGPLHYNNWEEGYIRDSNKEVALKLLHNLQNSVEYIINEAKKYSIKDKSFLMLYGISQNPDTIDYILVQNNSVNLTNWINGK